MTTLRVVGSGVNSVSQLTLEGLHHLRSAALVLYMGAIQAQLRELSLPHVEALNALYVDGDRDESNYARLLRRILDRLVTAADLALLLPGHPRLGVTLVQRLEQRSIEDGFDLIVVPGISSFDTMINDLTVDPLERGTLLVDVNRLLLFDQKLDPYIDTYIYHVCSVGTSATYYTAPETDNHLILLQRKLQNFFPAAHPVRLVESAAADTNVARVVEGTVDNLAEMVGQVTFSTTLYVPAMRRRTVDLNVLGLLAPGLKIHR